MLVPKTPKNSMFYNDYLFRYRLNLNRFTAYIEKKFLKKTYLYPNPMILNLFDAMDSLENLVDAVDNLAQPLVVANIR